MRKNKRRFKDGDILFRERDISNSMFFLVEGNVELRKTGERGPVMLAMLDSGEMFGEMGLVEGGERNAIAIAIGDIVVDEVSRDDFLAALAKEPKLAEKMMSKLTERLRQANERLSHPAMAVETIQQPESKFSMMGLFKKLVGGGNGPGRIEIRVFPFHAELPEAAEAQMHHVVRSLSLRPGFRTRVFTKIPPIEDDLHPEDRLMKLREYAEEGLANGQGDLAVFGDIPPPGTTLHLRFYSRLPDDEDRPGYCMPSTMLTLPVDFEPQWADLLLAVALSATSVRDRNKSMVLGQGISEALYAAMPAVQNLPQDLTTRERASIQMCYGNAVATLAYNRGTTDLYQVAVQTFRAALEQLSREDNPVEWALTQKHLGASLQAIAERNDDEDSLHLAVDALKAALGIFRIDSHSLQWASTQNRLGQVLYKLDLKTGVSETLKESLAAFQAALKVYNRNEYPSRWADVMNNFAQAAQVLGEQMHSTEALERAVDACHAALEIRRKEKGPLLWASTQNNLGSAMFLLGKLTRREDTLEGAAMAFDQALGVYIEFNAGRLSSVARKNLTRVQEEIVDVRNETEHTEEPTEKFDWGTDRVGRL